MSYKELDKSFDNEERNKLNTEKLKLEKNINRLIDSYTEELIEKSEFESQQIADFESQYQWFLAFGFLLLLADIFLLEKKTNWVQKLNLFNEKKHE